MKNFQSKAVLALLSGALLLASCDKNDKGSLSGPVPKGTFTSTSRTVGLTTEVTFTAASNGEAFLYSWDFGDGGTATGQTVTHAYTSGGTFQVQLITANRGGTAQSDKQAVVIQSTLNLVKQFLTNGSSRTWKLDNTVVAPITVGPSDADPTSYYAGNPAPGGLPGCQADDEYTFSNANVFTYDAKAETFVAGGACSAPRSVTTPFTFGAATGAGVGQFTLAAATPSPFIGVTDSPSTTYRILSIDNQHMLLRAGSTAGGVVFDMKFVVR